MKIASALFRENWPKATEVVMDPDDLDHDLLILWGGEDISPSLYGEPVVRAHAGASPSRRDKMEKELATRAIEKGIPILGICRGHQLLAAISGGKLFQHVDNHITRMHPIIYGERTVWSNSCHHQMVIPNDDMDVLAYTPCLSPIKVTTKVVRDEGDEAEIIHFKKIKALGVQGHPEWMPKDSEFVRLVEQLVKEKLNVNLS